MYTPAAFRETDTATLHELIRTHSFGLLVSAGADGAPVATHLPFFLDVDTGEHGTLVTHLARANPQWHAWEAETATTVPAEVLTVFSGPHAYISPTWYADPATPNVPTWNYAAVHAYGVPRLLTTEELRQALLSLSRQYEPAEGWQMAGLSEEYLAGKLRGIVGVAITLTRLEGKWKMSQNRSEADRQGVITALRRSVTEDGGQATADSMEARLSSG